MQDRIATARANPNIAFIKYWGNRDQALRLPENGSISMNLAGLETITTVRFSESPHSDRFVLNGEPQMGEGLIRVSEHLNKIRKLSGTSTSAEVISRNNFPTGTGIASSASAFAALTAAAATALNFRLQEHEISALARLGSGSASRSIPGGFVEWYIGIDHDSSFAESIAAADHWDLVDLVAVVSIEHKAVGSTGGHALAPTSPLQAVRISDTPRRLELCRTAIIERDFNAFAHIVEQDALMMHGVMMSSEPPLIYWLPTTLRVMSEVEKWRVDGIPVCFTIDAGPNVHVITTSEYADEVGRKIANLDGIQLVLTAHPGGPVAILDRHLSG
jgi:diphosphomevalonate decarboxylase